MVGLLEGEVSFLHETITEAAIKAAIRTDAVLSALLIVCLFKKFYLLLLHTFIRIQKSEENTLHADALFIVIVVKTVMRPARAPFHVFTVFAVFTAVRQRLSVDFESVFPDFAETVFSDVALDQLRPRFYIKACGDVAVRSDACRVNACATEEEEVPDIAFEIES
jgi:hypothetical protein